MSSCFLKPLLNLHELNGHRYVCYMSEIGPSRAEREVGRRAATVHLYVLVFWECYSAFGIIRRFVEVFT